MDFADIRSIRLASQQISSTQFSTVKELVGWMGAMQSQDFSMAKWAVGIRLPDSTDRLIETAINNAEILRTHVLRPTWHFVSANDIYWILALTTPQIRALIKSRQQQLELSGSVLMKSNSIIEKALMGGKHLNRDELKKELADSNIATDENRASHLFLQAELDGLICSGAIMQGKPTFALLEERVPKTRQLTRGEALAKLANQYFSSHNPASIRDFVWWSGLSVSDAKAALEMVKKDLISETIGAQTYWFGNSFTFPKPNEEAVYLLPAYDEYIISYTDRSAALTLENRSKSISDNGIFKPVVIVNGQVAGLWKRTVKNNRIMVEVEYFEPPDQAVHDRIANAALRFGQFCGMNVEIKLRA